MLHAHLIFAVKHFLLIYLFTSLSVSVRELQKKLGDECLKEAYSYLKRARYDDRRPGTDINEDRMLHDLSEIVPSADDRLRVDQLLFLEMQISI